MTLLWTDGATDPQVCLILIYPVQNFCSRCMRTWQVLMTGKFLCKQVFPLLQAHVCGRGRH